MSPISDKKSNLNLLEIWANVSHNLSFSNWASLNHLVSSRLQFLSSWLYCIKSQINNFIVLNTIYVLVNLGYSSLLQLIAIQKGHVRLITLYNNYKVNRVYWTVKKKGIYYELLALTLNYTYLRNIILTGFNKTIKQMDKGISRQVSLTTAACFYCDWLDWLRIIILANISIEKVRHFILCWSGPGVESRTLTWNTEGSYTPSTLSGWRFGRGFGAL